MAAGLEGGSSYISDLVFKQTLGRAFHSFHHRHPFFYYLIAVWPLLLPWSFIALRSLILHLRHRSSSISLTGFATCSAMLTFIILSLASSKLSIYLLPFVPPVIALAVHDLYSVHEQRGERLALIVGSGLFTLVVPACLVTQCFIHSPFLREPLVWGASVVLSMGGFVSLLLVLRHRNADGVISLSVSILLATFLAGFAFPNLNEWIGYRHVCEVASQVKRSYPASQIVTCGVKRSSEMDVFLGAVPNSIDTTCVKTQLMAGTVVIAPTGKAKRLQLVRTRQCGPWVVGLIE